MNLRTDLSLAERKQKVVDYYNEFYKKEHKK